MAGDFNMVLLPQDRLSKRLESGAISPSERAALSRLMDRFGLKEIEQPLHTYRHTDSPPVWIECTSAMIGLR